MGYANVVVEGTPFEKSFMIEVPSKEFRPPPPFLTCAHVHKKCDQVTLFGLDKIAN